MEASPAVQSRRIGAILVDNNLITEEQLARALEIQAETGERLGEIVVAEFGVARLELASVLAERWADLEKTARETGVEPVRPLEAVAEPLVPAEVGIRRPIGDIFVELGFITREQLDAALEAQRKSGARIGEILVEQGSLSRLDLASALAEQWSPAQGLRPPAPVAEPQPWQHGVPAPAPVPAAAEQGWSADDRAVVAALEERLRVVERAAAATPWQDDLRSATSELRAAVSSVEERLEVHSPGATGEELTAAWEAVSSRIDALESASVSREVEALRQEVEGLKTRPVTVEGIADLRAAVERLEARPDRADEIQHLAGEIAGLSTRLDETAGVGELKGELEALAGQARVAETGLHELSRRVDGLAEDRDGSRLEQPEVAALVARVDQLSARVEDVVAPPALDLTPRIDDLSARVDQVAAAIPAAGEGLAARIESLEEEGRASNGALERLASELAELGTHTEEQLRSLSALEPNLIRELQARLDEVTATVGREPDTAPLEELRTRLEELAASVARGVEASDLDGIRARLEELSGVVQREPDLDRLDELRTRVDDLAAAVERQPDASLLDGMRARLEGIAAAVERQADPAQVDDLNARVNDLAAAVAQSPDAAQLDGLRSRLDELATATVWQPDPGSVDELRARVEHVSALIAQKPDTASVDELRARLHELAAAIDRDDSARALEARVGEIEQRLATAAPAAELRAEMHRIAESTAAERESLAQALYARVEEITSAVPREEELKDVRLQLEELAARSTEDHLLRARVDELAGRLDGLGSAEGAITEFRRSLEDIVRARAGDLFATEARLSKLEAAIDSIAGLEARIREGDDLADRARILAARLDGTESRLVAVDALEASVSAFAEEMERRPDGDALVGLASELRAELGEHRSAVAARFDEAGAAIRADLEARGAWLDSQLQAQGSETGALRARVDELQEAAAGHAAREARLESMFEQRLEVHASRISDEVVGARADAEQAVEAVRGEMGSLGARIDELHGLLASRISDEVVGARADAEQAVEAVRGEMGFLAARIDELHGLRHADVQAERAASDRLAERVDEIAGLRAEDAEVARFAAADLAARLESLAASLHAEAADARAAVDGVTEQIQGLHGLRADDLAVAELAAAALVARLDDHAARSAEAAFAVEQALREELGGIAARLEERDAGGIEAREELRAELERVASSVGWRLERIEESLASDESAELRSAVAALERRLAEQAAIGEEQVRTTERALRKGLASLGERLVETESAYHDAGNALRRSIERLGAAVVEADARLADQIPVSEVEGCVAFAPTAEGYRLVELPGRPPEIGSTVELDVSDGPLVVTRYGRSPLPLDSRPCAYLDRL